MSPNPHHFAVIMAGGSGSRFWPMSRKRQPKQFLRLAGSDRSLIRESVERLSGLIPAERILVVTGEEHAEHAARELPEIPPENLLVEPVARNTAPCMAWATRVAIGRDPLAVLAVLPADHWVPDREAFQRHLTAAFDAAETEIVLLGLVPTAPETGYGYIELGGLVEHQRGLAVHEVQRFVEKPDGATALGYLDSGRYLWNSGMFVFSAARFEAAVRSQLPELAAGMDRLEREGSSALAGVFASLPKVSVDYGIMEKETGLRVIPSSFPWSDLGSWDSVIGFYPRDDQQNVLRGDVLLADTHGVFVEAGAGRVVALVGVSDLIVVDTPDALLVLRRGASQQVKSIVEALEREGRVEWL